MKKIILIAAILAGSLTFDSAIAQKEQPLPEHTCVLDSDGLIICTAGRLDECQQLIDHVRLNGSIEGVDVVRVSSRCEKIGSPLVAYQAIFELL
jgi:hypothetical protein